MGDQLECQLHCSQVQNVVMLLIVCRRKDIFERNLNPMMILKLIGSNIRTLRLKAGLSQEQLAELASLHRTYIGAVERGERNVSAVNIGRIAKALRVSPHVLLMEHTDAT